MALNKDWKFTIPTLPKDLYRRLQAEAERSGQSNWQIVVAALSQYLGNQQAPSLVSTVSPPPPPIPTIDADQALPTDIFDPAKDYSYDGEFHYMTVTREGRLIRLRKRDQGAPEKSPVDPARDGGAPPTD